MPIKFLVFKRTKLPNGVEIPVEFKVASIEQMRSSETFMDFRTFELPVSKSDAALQSETDSKVFDLVFQNIVDICSEESNSIVIVPDGELYNARFSCIKTGNNGSRSYAVSISPSLKMILDTKSPSIISINQTKRILIIGDPRSDLPFAFEESKLLIDLFQEQSDWNVDALIGSKATKQSLIEGLIHCNIIHIAAHANSTETDTLQVLRGSVLLASSNSGLFY